MARYEISRAEADRLASKFGFDQALKMIQVLPYRNLRQVLKMNNMLDFQNRPEQPYVVTVPGFDDVVHLGQDAADFSDGELQLIEQVRLHYDPRTADRILSKMLGPKYLYRMDRAQFRARRIRQSPTPQIVRDIGEIMTLIDDVQDGLVTLTYLLRVLVPLVGKLAPRLLAKAVPVVGWISLAADVLSLLQLVQWLAMPLPTGKRATRTLLDFAPRLRGKKLLAVGKLKDLLPSFAEAIQIAQTTDVLFGYGVSLGPVYGFVEDVFFGKIREEYPGGPEVEIDSTPFVEGFPGVVQPFLSGLPTVAMSPKREVYAKPLDVWDSAALKIMRAAPYVLALGPELSTQDRAMTLAAVSLATETLQDSGATVGMVEKLGPAVDVLLPAPRISSTVKNVLRREGISYNTGQARWPHPVGDSRTSPRLQAALLAPAVVEGINAGFEADKGSLYSVMGGHFITESCDGLLRLSEGTDVVIQDTVRPEGKALFTLWHHNLISRLDSRPEHLLRVYGLLSAEYVKSGRDQFTYDETVAMINLVDGFKKS